LVFQTGLAMVTVHFIFLLYSIGWEETKDGGLLADNGIDTKGDWAWHYSTE
jgi:hypothetical protein